MIVNTYDGYIAQTQKMEQRAGVSVMVMILMLFISS
jgi:hypothetical protein